MKPTPLMSRLLFRPTLCWTLLKTRGLKTEEHWTAIDETLILGALPTKRELAEFESLDIGGVINMCAEWKGHTSRYARCDIEQLHLPTPDYTSPDLTAVRNAVEFIARFAEHGRRVYCHCKAGRGRSATIALAWLMHSRPLEVQAAEELLRERRPQVNRHLANREAIRDFLSSLQLQY